MKKIDKNLFVYALIMICVVLVIVLAVLFSQNKISDLEEGYKTEISETQKKTQAYQEKMVALEEKNKTLKKEKEEAEKKLAEKGEESAGQTEYIQQMKILSDIYNIIEDKNFAEAKSELEKLDGVIKDETAENFKKALEGLIKAEEK